MGATSQIPILRLRNWVATTMIGKFRELGTLYLLRFHCEMLEQFMNYPGEASNDDDNCNLQ